MTASSRDIPARAALAATAALSLLVTVPLCAQAQQAVILVTNEEAALPPLPESGEQGKGITRGPGIEPLTPGNGVTIAAPTPFRIRFTQRNDVPINPDKVRVTYLRNQPVDITLRLRSYVTPNGIDIPLASVPPGHHVFRIQAEDGLGRQTTAVFHFDAKGKN
ncbi:hypothetical protein [uncultured Bosea sp.]|uniref:hypothetical protein n=1 Tax=uncultured Bosea sp. TaxID=211457 RepID=UPI0025E8FE7A|nr:hypothetical protein [uncultured Bosea sp.]